MPAKLKCKDLKKEKERKKKTKILWLKQRRQKQDVMENMYKVTKKRLDKSLSPVQKNSDEVFGTVITAELDKLPEIYKIRANQEINNIIFKIQMESRNFFASGSLFLSLR